MYSKITGWVANSVDPDQTAPWSGSALFAQELAWVTCGKTYLRMVRWFSPGSPVFTHLWWMIGSILVKYSWKGRKTQIKKYSYYDMYQAKILFNNVQCRSLLLCDFNFSESACRFCLCHCRLLCVPLPCVCLEIILLLNFMSWMCVWCIVVYKNCFLIDFFCNLCVLKHANLFCPTEETGTF